jgi:hypothetical protein
MTMQIFDCEQGSPEWFAARMGIPTASEFATLIAVKKDAKDKKTRTTYMRKLAGEIITGQPMESYNNAYMERGKEFEDEARNAYAFLMDAEPRKVGFIRRNDAGCSPDSLIGEDGGLEIKVAVPHIQIERLEAGTLPSEHRAQVQGSMFVTGRKHWDFVSYCPGMPLVALRVPRDEEYIGMIAAAVDEFNRELADLVARIRNFDRKAAA